MIDFHIPAYREAFRSRLQKIVFQFEKKPLEIKPCELGSRIQEAFSYKTEIKIIYFVQLCVIVILPKT